MRPAFLLGFLFWPGLALANPVSIRGHVTYAGEAPTPVRVAPEVNPEVCGAQSPIVDEGLVVGEGGALANVAVMLVGITERAPAVQNASLQQHNCVFSPHVQTISEGSNLLIGNDDPVVHNVHARLGQETIFNLGMPLRGTRITRQLDQSGVVGLSCDSGHTWMQAYLIVVPHSFHATSKADGWFVIGDVDPGRYTLRAWHERLGVLDLPVTVDPERGAEVEIRFPGGPLLEAPPPLSFALPPEAPAAAPTAGAMALPPALASTAGVPFPVGAPDRSAERLAARAAGVGLYRRHCASCHGERGDGRGEAIRYLEGIPRDFTRGEFKFRSTRSGDLPTAADLARTIGLGVPGTEMPPFARSLAPADRLILARYLMTFSERFLRAPGPSLPIPKAPAESAAAVQRGREIWTRLKCAQCHGDAGAADGVSRAMIDDFGRPISAPDLTRGVYKSGPAPADLYRTLVTGLSGTPMPAFAELLSPAELWDLVSYVRSLAEARPFSKFLGLP